MISHKEDEKMEDETTVVIIFLVGLIILSFTATCYMHKVKKYENFQNTIKDLTDEQKCLHICGFQYPESMYFDNYKYCVEKCDRISERAATACN